MLIPKVIIVIIATMEITDKYQCMWNILIIGIPITVVSKVSKNFVRSISLFLHISSQNFAGPIQLFTISDLSRCKKPKAEMDG